MNAIKRIAPLLLAAAALLAPAAADAAWKIKGRGFGHGVGLSQYGAFGFAEHGRNYRQIISHYFVKTKLGKDAGQVRVLLGSGQGSVSFSGAARGMRQAARRAPTGTRSRSPRARSSCAARAATGSPTAAPRARRRAGSRSRASGRYRGSLVARATGGNMLVINQLPLGGLRQGRGPERGPLLVAGRGAPGAGGRRALLRAGDRALRRLRPLRRHPQPGLRRQGLGDQGDQPGGRGDGEAGRHLPRPAGDHLLLLDLRRARPRTRSSASRAAARSPT